MRLLVSLLVMLLLIPISFFNRAKSKKLHHTNSKLYIAKVANNISVGPFTSNKNLALGVRNVLAEVGQDKGLELVDDPVDADIALVVELVYLDIEQSKSNVSVFHKDENSVIIKMRGTTYDGLGKKIQSILVEEKSTETSTSTFLTNDSGQFNSQVARQAVKKTCVSLANKLL
jgi:uncharacterized protein YtpQ (UPF0354 family)